MLSDPRDDHYFEDEWYEDDWDYEDLEEQPTDDEGHALALIHKYEEDTLVCESCRRIDLSVEDGICDSCALLLYESFGNFDEEEENEFAEWAFTQADAMLVGREKSND